jgi:hypothetical protein
MRPVPNEPAAVIFLLVILKPNAMATAFNVAEVVVPWDGLGDGKAGRFAYLRKRSISVHADTAPPLKRSEVARKLFPCDTRVGK